MTIRKNDWECCSFCGKGPNVFLETTEIGDAYCWDCLKIDFPNVSEQTWINRGGG